MLKQTLWNISDQSELKYRLSQLKNDAQRQWGTMDAAQMLRHIDIAYKNSIGEVSVPRQSLASIASLKPIKWVIIYLLPFQKNLPTAQEYKISSSIDFNAAHQTFSDTLDRMIKNHESFRFVEHPIFGKLSKEEWGALLYKHLDHHLKQFSV